MALAVDASIARQISADYFRDVKTSNSLAGFHGLDDCRINMRKTLVPGGEVSDEGLVRRYVCVELV